MILPRPSLPSQLGATKLLQTSTTVEGPLRHDNIPSLELGFTKINSEPLSPVSNAKKATRDSRTKSRRDPSPIKIASTGQLTLIDCGEYVKETLHSVFKSLCAPFTRQSHKDQVYHTLLWRCTAQCLCATALASLCRQRDQFWSLVHGSLISLVLSFAVTACILQNEGAKLIVKGVGIRRIESLVATATADVFWSDQDGTLTKRSRKTVRWENAVALPPYGMQDLQDMTALAMGTSGARGIYNIQSMALQQKLGLSPVVSPKNAKDTHTLVSRHCMIQNNSGAIVSFAVADPCNCKDYNALHPRLSTRGIKYLFRGLGDLDNAKELQSVVQRFYDSGQACHIVLTGRQTSNGEPTKIQAAGVYPVHSPILSSTKATINRIEKHGLKFKLATAASQNYAHLVGRAIQTNPRRLSHSPLLEATAGLSTQTLDERRALISQIMSSHGGVSCCGRLNGGKALLMNASREAGYSNIMLGDGFNDVEAMRVADVAVGAGLHSYWDVLETADVIIGVNTSKQDISGLGSLLDGALTATLRVVRYLEALRLMHQIGALYVVTSMTLRLPQVDALWPWLYTLLPLCSLLNGNLSVGRHELIRRLQLPPWRHSLFTATLPAFAAIIASHVRRAMIQSLTVFVECFAQLAEKVASAGGPALPVWS